MLLALLSPFSIWNCQQNSFKWECMALPQTFPSLKKCIIIIHQYCFRTKYLAKWLKSIKRNNLVFDLKFFQEEERFWVLFGGVHHLTPIDYIIEKRAKQYRMLTKSQWSYKSLAGIVEEHILKKVPLLPACPILCYTLALLHSV